jgi:cellulose synthase operon protein C
MEPFMLRRISISTLSTALLLAGMGESRAADDPRFAYDFVQALRDHGYFDVALQYLEALRDDPEVPDALKKNLAFEEGRTLIAEATHSQDPDFSKAKLEQAKVKLDSFVQANPDSPQTTDALVELAHLLYERGLNEVDMAGDARGASDKESKLAAARGYYQNARLSYTKAFERLNNKLVEYPKYIPPEDPRKLERERLRNTVMQAELQKSVINYYEAQTYPHKSSERVELLEKGLAEFDDIYKRYRNQIAGFTARMWQGKCFEEQDKLGEATGIYKELMDHNDPALLPLQKQVAYFQIIVAGKRKEYPRAADECVEWLRHFPKDKRSYEALGVRFELAKDIIAQLPELSSSDKDKAIRTATDYLKEVVQVVSPFKPEAIELLQKYRPNAALSASDVSKLNYDDALAQATQAISTLAYENATVLLKLAIRKADPAREPAKANKARYMLAYASIMNKRPYEAAVVGEFVARHYPRDDWAAKSADLAMQALVDAYNQFVQGNRTVDLDRLVDLAKYTAETWPDTEQGDNGKMMKGLVELGRGEYTDAIAAFEAVRSSSAKWIDAQNSCGDAHWRQSLLLREKGSTKEADAEVKQALDKYNASLKARKDAHAPDTDLGVVTNSCDLALIQLETSKPSEALAMLDPIAKKLAVLTGGSGPEKAAYARVLSYILRAHVATGKVDLAIADMKTIEAIGGAGNSAAQLYFELGRLLEREIEALKRRNDKAGLERTEQAYRKFLNALVASKSGQSFGSLRWAADNLLKLGSAKEASEVYSTLINTYGKDPQFLKGTGSLEQITLVRLKQVAALRTVGNLPEAETLLNEIMEQNKRSIEPQMEKGFLLEAKAAVKQGTWVGAYNHWKALALKLGSMSPKPTQYYEAWYQAALDLKAIGDAERDATKKRSNYDMAKATLRSVMKLSNNLGTPEIQAKYDQLTKQLGK